MTALDLLVHITPGADPSADLSGAKWTDITQYARAKVRTARGRSNESGQAPPTSCDLRLDNEGGRFVVRNPLAPWYPLLRRNTPLRVRLRRARDTFDGRTVSNGLGTATSGQAWTVSSGAASAWSVSSNTAQCSISAVNSYRRVLLAASLRDCEQSISITAPADLTGASLVWRHLFRWIDASNHYALSAELDRNTGSGLTVTCKIRRTLAGVTSEIAVASPVPGLLYTAGQPVHIRAGVAAAHLGIKAWVGDPVTAEPDGWSVEVDDYAFTEPGLVGQDVYLVVGNTNALPYVVSFDNYALCVDRFTGYLDELPIHWQPGETDTYVDATASGITRRLQQGIAPRSALERLLSRSSPIVYWPLEDGTDSTQAASGIPGGAPMVVNSGIMTFGSTAPAGSAGSAQPEVDADNALSSPVSGGSSTSWQMSVWTRGVGGSGPYYIPAEVRTSSGKILRFVMQHASPPSAIAEYDTEEQPDSTNFFAVSASSLPANPIDDREWHLLQATFTQSGANTNAAFYFDGVLADSGTWTSVTIGAPTSVSAIGRFGGILGEVSFNMTEIYLAHLAIHNGATIVDQYDAGTGYIGETAAARIDRLYDEESVPARVDAAAESLPMGPQLTAALLPLVRECADTDCGIAYERTDGTAGYLPRVDRYNRAAQWALAYGNLAPPLRPVDDDQQLRNDVTASRPNGSSARYVDEAHVLLEGRYDERISVNPSSDGALQDAAGWRVFQGTADELRYPAISVNLIGQDDQVEAWLNCDIGSRITISDPPVELAVDLIDQVIEGYEEVLDAFQWDLTLHCSPARVWDVATADGEPRAPAYGSTVASTLALGAMSLSLASTTANGVWVTGTTITNTTDFPMDLRVGGEQVTASGISGGTSPQTVTLSARGVNGVTRAWDAGTEVDVWEPPIAPL